MAIAAWAFAGAEGVPFDAIVILAIIVLNAILGYVQEARAEAAVSALQRMAAETIPARPSASPAISQVAVVELPYMNEAFRTTPLGLGDSGICVVPASVVLWADELRKLVARRSRPASAPGGA